MRVEAGDVTNCSPPPLPLPFKDAANGEFFIGTSLHVSQIWSQKPELQRTGTVLLVFDSTVYSSPENGSHLVQSIDLMREEHEASEMFMADNCFFRFESSVELQQLVPL